MPQPERQGEPDEHPTPLPPNARSTINRIVCTDIDGGTVNGHSGSSLYGSTRVSTEVECAELRGAVSRISVNDGGNNSMNNKPTKFFWAVMKAHRWSCVLSHGIPLKDPKGDRGGASCRFIPLFSTRREAIEFGGSRKHVKKLTITL